VEQNDVYLEMRLKIESVFEHYAAQSEHYKRANIVQRFAMQDTFYRLIWNCSRELLGVQDLSTITAAALVDEGCELPTSSFFQIGRFLTRTVQDLKSRRMTAAAKET